MEAYVTVCC